MKNSNIIDVINNYLTVVDILDNIQRVVVNILDNIQTRIGLVDSNSNSHTVNQRDKIYRTTVIVVLYSYMFKSSNSQ